MSELLQEYCEKCRELEMLVNAFNRTSREKITNGYRCEYYLQPGCLLIPGEIADKPPAW